MSSPSERCAATIRSARQEQSTPRRAAIDSGCDLDTSRRPAQGLELPQPERGDTARAYASLPSGLVRKLGMSIARQWLLSGGLPVVRVLPAEAGSVSVATEAVRAHTAGSRRTPRDSWHLWRVVAARPVGFGPQVGEIQAEPRASRHVAHQSLGGPERPPIAVVRPQLEDLHSARLGVDDPPPRQPLPVDQAADRIREFATWLDPVRLARSGGLPCYGAPASRAARGGTRTVVSESMA